ncbi:MAG: endonuclease III [Lentisphaerae bacterium]|nr:endonuclease III [Lentisphaerota bacterium]
MTSSATMQPAAFQRILRTLRRAYGPLPVARPEPPLDVLIQTILSQNTSDLNSLRAYRSLRRQFPRWSQVAAASEAEIASAIHSGGLARIKAARIRQVLQIIHAPGGRAALRRLKKMDQAQALSWLTSLPGVGVKTASCVLLFALGLPAMPVDTHVYRLVIRLGWVAPRQSVAAVTAALEKLIPARMIRPLHLYLIEHGRRICRPQRPACDQCVLRPDCVWVIHNAPSA